VLHKEIPFLRICLPLCAGIITGLWFSPAPLFLILSGSIAAVFLVLSFFSSRYTDNRFFGIAFSIALFIAGLLLYRNEKESLAVLGNEEAIFSCTLSDYPEEKPASYMITVEMKVKYSPEALPVNGSLLLYVKKDDALKTFLPGDELLLRCKPAEIENRGNPYEFDYRFFMENRGIKYFSFINTEDILRHESPEHRKLRHRALITRNRIIQIYRMSGVPEDQIPLLSAITLGEKSGLDQEQKQIFIKAGIMHVMAVSGLHAVILSLFVFNLLFFLRYRFRILRIALTIIFIWAFAFVTGLTPSVLRATLMFSFLQAGTLMHRKVNGINSVLASAFVLILMKPSVIFDAGFLLSYSAVIYIIMFYNMFYRKLEFKNVIPDKIWQSAAVTIIAQLGTLPLTIMLFNRFPVYFILTNVIIVPVTSLIIIAGCIVPLLYPISTLSHIPGAALGHLTGLTEFLTRKAASLPGSNIENIGITTPMCVLLVILIFTLTRFLLNREKGLLLPLAVALFFAIVTALTGIRVKTTREVIVYNTQGSPVVGIRTGKILNVYSDSLNLMPATARHCSVLGLKPSMHPLPETSMLLMAGDKKILIYRKGRMPVIKDCDIAIFCGAIQAKVEFRDNPAYIILASGMNIPRYLDKGHDGSIHIIRKSGAFRTSM
jgi:competence protein ComEC